MNWVSFAEIALFASYIGVIYADTKLLDFSHTNNTVPSSLLERLCNH